VAGKMGEPRGSPANTNNGLKTSEASAHLATPKVRRAERTSHED
jgi:hypothetical protein